jgi:hypothetical protein
MAWAALIAFTEPLVMMVPTLRPYWKDTSQTKLLSGPNSSGSVPSTPPTTR